MAGKHGETASSVVVKLLSKAISDQIRSADGSVMTLSCMYAAASGQMKGSASITGPFVVNSVLALKGLYGSSITCNCTCPL